MPLAGYLGQSIGCNMEDMLVFLVSLSAVKLVSSLIIRNNKNRQFEKVGTVSELNLYPVKSCKGISLEKATCSPQGILADAVTDRTWMVAKPDGECITQRRYPQMALMKVSLHDGFIHIDAPDMPTLKMPKDPPVEKNEVLMCNVFGGHLPGRSCGPEADEWISRYLDTPGYRIVFSSSTMKKKEVALVDLGKIENVAMPYDVCAFSDVCPFLVAAEESLSDLNRRLKTPVTMKNFRPNIVVKGLQTPFDEDNWREIRIGEDCYMRCLNPCGRCKLTTNNPSTGKLDPEQEPLKTLKTFRMRKDLGNETLFGVNAAVDIPREVKVGDPVYVLRK